MKVFVKSKGDIDLNKNNYVTSGGEGHIYVKDRTVYKIYIDRKKCLPVEKIKELSKITKKNIIIPKELVSMYKIPVGYTMAKVETSVSVCQIFPKVFRDRNNLGVKDILELVNQLRDGIKHCHEKNILVVDVNEMNFLVDSATFSKLYFIDTDSYQTPHFKATAIMESVRDRLHSKFSENTDWFSFAIIAFQMFIGIHPYKGRHPQYKILDERMLNSVSVFNKDVKTPKIIPPITAIPENYRLWMKTILEDKQRSAPPFTDIAVVVINVPTIKIVSTHFIVDFVKKYDENIIKYTKNWTLTAKALYHQGGRNSQIAPYSCIVDMPGGGIISIIITDGNAVIYGVINNNTTVGDHVFSCDNRLYIKQENNIVEIQLVQHGEYIHLDLVAKIVGSATIVIDGGLIQNLLGEMFVSFFPKSRHHYQLKIPELNKHRILNGKIIKNVLIVIGEQNNTYTKFIIKTNDNYSDYKIRQEHCETTDINFTMLDNGTCVTVNYNGFIELFSSKIESNDIKIIKDDTLVIGHITSIDNTVYNIVQNEAYSLSLKK